MSTIIETFDLNGIEPLGCADIFFSSNREMSSNFKDLRNVLFRFFGFNIFTKNGLPYPRTKLD